MLQRLALPALGMLIQMSQLLALAAVGIEGNGSAPGISHLHNSVGGQLLLVIP